MSTDLGTVYMIQVTKVLTYEIDLNNKKKFLKFINKNKKQQRIN